MRAHQLDRLLKRNGLSWVVAMVVSAASLGAAGLCHAVSLGDALPRPGLYRIDADGTLMRDGGRSAVRQQTDGATGTLSATVSVDDGGTYSQGHAGAGTLTHCIRAPAQKQLSFLPAHFGGGRCSGQHTAVTSAGVVHTALCQGARSRLTVLQLARDCWEYLSETEISGGMKPGLDGVRAGLENQVRHGATATQRAQAAQRLKALPQMQADMLEQQRQARSQLEATRRAARTPEEAAMIDKAIAQLHQSVP
jgi:hypothetical protein